MISLSITTFRTIKTDNTLNEYFYYVFIVYFSQDYQDYLHEVLQTKGLTRLPEYLVWQADQRIKMLDCEEIVQSPQFK